MRLRLGSGGWRGGLGRELAWIFALKLVALSLLWLLFFSHRSVPGDAALARQLAVSHTSAPASRQSSLTQETRRD